MLLPNIQEWRRLYTLSFMVAYITTHVSCLSVHTAKEPIYDRQVTLTSSLRYRLILLSNTIATPGTVKRHCYKEYELSSAKSTKQQRRLPRGVKLCSYSSLTAPTMSRCCLPTKLMGFSK